MTTSTPLQATRPYASVTLLVDLTFYPQCAAVLGAGMDLECGNYLLSTLGSAINDSSVRNQQKDQNRHHY